MLSKIYKSVREILTHSTENETPKPSQDTTESTPEDMVKTRRPQDDDLVNGEADQGDSIIVHVPSSSKRRRKHVKDIGEKEASEEEMFATPSAKKRKTLPVREKDEFVPSASKTRLVVEIPVKNLGIEPEPVEDDASESDSENLWSEDEHAEVVVNRTKHRRFGNEEEEDEIFSTARDQENVEEIEDSEKDSESSDDDAPEAIGKEEAVQTVKSKERDAAKAVQSQLSASRQKRKERDEILKKQAESSKKRKVDLIAKNTSDTTKTDTTNNESNDEEEDHQLTDSVSKRKAKRNSSKGLSIRDMQSLPNLLPAEYLEDTEPTALVPLESRLEKKSKKTKFNQLAEKGPKDRRIGTTTYRVTKAVNADLAPKSSYHARSTKESWLQGRSGNKVDLNRKPFSKSFSGK